LDDADLSWKSLQATPAPAAVPTMPVNFNGSGLSTSSVQFVWTDVLTEDSYELHDASEVVKASAPRGAFQSLKRG